MHGGARGTERSRHSVFAVSFVEEEEDTPAVAQASVTKHGTSTFATSVQVAKCCFCACFLFVPNGFKLAGMVGGPLYLLWVYAFMMWAIHCLIESRRVRGHGRYQDLALVWGKTGQECVRWIIAGISFGFNCIWVAGIAVNLGMLFPTWSGNARLFFFLPLVALLSLVRHLKYFTGANLVGLIISAVTYCYLLGYAGRLIAYNGAKPVMLFDTSDFNSLIWLGQCGYMFEMITFVVPIYETAIHKDSVFTIILAVSGTLMLMYLIIGYTTYLAFGDQTEEIALLNLPQGSIAGYVLPGLYAVSGALTIPINNFVICLSYESLVSWPPETWKRTWLENLGRFALVSSIFAVTWLGGAQLQNFLGLVGGVLGMLLALVVPCLLHLSICKPAGLSRIFDYVTVVIGVQIMATSLYLSLSTWKA